MELQPPQWQPVVEPRLVYRWVKHSSSDHEDFIENFVSDAERGEKPLEGEHPDYMHGRSAFDSLENARSAWERIYVRLKARSKGKPVKMRVGHFIAEIELRPGDGFEIDAPLNADPRGHLWIKGDKTKLAAATGTIYAADINAD
ncbi:MAG: hypothetical protein WAU69_10890 [Solirubrobacteraceae bacterium]